MFATILSFPFLIYIVTNNFFPDFSQMMSVGDPIHSLASYAYAGSVIIIFLIIIFLLRETEIPRGRGVYSCHMRGQPRRDCERLGWVLECLKVFYCEPRLNCFNRAANHKFCTQLIKLTLSLITARRLIFFFFYYPSIKFIRPNKFFFTLFQIKQYLYYFFFARDI